VNRELLVRLESVSRQPFEVWGFRFGQGERTAAIVAGLRGTEALPLHAASRLVRWLQEHEHRLLPGREVLVIPAANPASFNTGRRFWGLDDTDLNRMFPGYEAGETTQRIAGRLMKALEGYSWGVNLTSINHPGTYVPHVRFHRTGWEDLAGARAFGLPDIHLHEPNAQETGSLNYNWQVWNTKAYSLVGGRAFHAESADIRTYDEALLRFLSYVGALSPRVAAPPGRVWADFDLIRVVTSRAGLFEPLVRPGEFVREGQPLAHVTDALEGRSLETLVSPRSAKVFYALETPLVHAPMVAFTLVPAGSTMGE